MPRQVFNVSAVVLFLLALSLDLTGKSYAGRAMTLIATGADPTTSMPQDPAPEDAAPDGAASDRAATDRAASERPEGAQQHRPGQRPGDSVAR